MTRRALLIGSQTSGLLGVNSDVEAIAAFLAERGFSRDVLIDDSATRDGIIAGLRRLIADTEDGDTVVLYYSGHGGQIDNRRHLDDSSEPRVYTCIIPSDHNAQNFRGIFSAELAAFVAELSLKTHNITVILDCCHAAGVNLGDNFVAKGIAIPWNAEVAKYRDHLAAEGYDLGARADFIENNPHVVRLAACRTSQLAYERVDAEQSAHGLLTEAFLEIVGDLNDDQPTWQAIGAGVAARVRERFADQDPVVIGPEERLLFDTTTVPRSDVLLYEVRAGERILTGGSLHFVTPKSRYLLMPLNANRADRDLALAEAEVVDVSTDFARVTIELPDGAAPPRTGTRAFLYDPALRRYPVAFDGLSPSIAVDLSDLIVASPRLRLPDEEANERLMTVREIDSTLTLHDRYGYRIHHPWPLDPDPERTTKLLHTVIIHAEQLARVCDLLDQPPAEGPTALSPAPRVRWGRVGDVTSVYLPSAGARLPVDDRIYIHASSESPSRVYVSVLGVGVDRSIRLLSSSSPSGMELRPGESYTLGQDDVGQRFGIPLAWHPDVPDDGAQPLYFVVISTDIPVDLRSLESATSAAKGLVRSLDELFDPVGGIVNKGSGLPSRLRSARYDRVTLDLLLEPKARVDSQASPTIDAPVVVVKDTPLTLQPSKNAPVRFRLVPRPSPIKVLFISARPAGMVAINSEAERRAIRESLQTGGSRIYTFDDQPAASRQDVISELAASVAVIHFSCHGEERLGLLLEDENGNRDTVPSVWLVERVRQNPSIGLVALSACHSEEHALAVAAAGEVDAIGFRGEIGEHYARSFYGLLYEMLARGFTIADSYDRALGALPEAIQGQVVLAGPKCFPATRGERPEPVPDPGPFPFIPSNIDFEGIDVAALGDLDISALNTSVGTETKAIQSEFSKLQFKLIDQEDGSRVAVYFAKSVRIAPNASLRFTGPNAAALVALLDMKIFGALIASPEHFGKSPGGYQNDGSSNPRAGGPGGGVSNSEMNGGGGGSYGGIGGHGAARVDGAVALPGKPYGNLEIIPLVGGSAGGGGSGGSGGGALQLVAGTRILIGPVGSINCGGGAGGTGGAAGWQQGNGGGSGGAILIEASTVDIKGVLAANGGGAGSGHMAMGLWGEDGLASDQPAAGTNPGSGRPVGARGSASEMLDGEDGVTSESGKCGGGGGGAGRMRINTDTGTATITGTVSPALGTPCATQGRLRMRED